MIKFKVGDIVELRNETKTWAGQTVNGRLQYGTRYEVLKITKQGHLLLQTKWGKTHYSVKMFDKVFKPEIILPLNRLPELYEKYKDKK
jgi:hypothetical protein